MMGSKVGGDRLKIVMVEPLGRGGWAQYTASLMASLSRIFSGMVLFTSSSSRLVGRKLPYRLKAVLFTFSNRLITSLGLERFRRIRQLCKGVEVHLNHLKLIRYCCQNRPDILHFQLLFPFELPWVLCYRALGIKLVYTIHDILSHTPYPWDRFLYRYLYGLMDAIIVHARTVKDDLLATYPKLASSRVFFHPMGNVTEVDSLPVLSRKESRRLLHYPASEKIILFFGFIRPYKGLAVLLKALALLRSSFPQVRLMIAGEAVEKFTPYQKLIEQLKISAIVDTRIYQIPFGEIPIYFGSCDLVAVPYLEAYQSAIIPLAYSFQRPVVASRVGGLPEIVEEGRTGFLCSPDDPAALAAAIGKIIGDPATARSMEEYIPRYLQANFSWQSIAEETARIYRRTRPAESG